MLMIITLALLILVFSIIIVFLIVKKDKIFTANAISHIAQRYPDLATEIISKGGLKGYPEIRVYSKNSDSLISNLRVMIIEPRAKDSYGEEILELDADLNTGKNIKENWFIKIIRRGIVSNILHKERYIVLGIEAIDDKLIINGHPEETASKSIIKFQPFLLKLAEQDDFIRCKLIFTNYVLKAAILFKRTDIHALDAIFSLFDTLTNTFQASRRLI